MPDYPGSYDLPNIITVAAMDQNDQLSLFSNIGAASVDIAAPGEQVLSTLPTGYGYGSGTSMASPHVAGVAALVLSVHPTWTTAQIRDRILRTVRPVSSLEGLVASGGMVNAAAAVGGSPNLAPVVTITKPSSGTSVLRGSTVTFSATAVDPEQGNVASSISWVDSLMGEIGTGPTISRGDLVEGTHVIVAIARDAAHHTPLAAITLRVGPEIRTIDEHADPASPAIAVGAGGTPVLAWAGAGDRDRRQPPRRIGLVAGGRHELGRRRVARTSPLPRTARCAWQSSRDWSNPGAFRDTGILVATDDGTGSGTGWKLTRVSEACGDDAIGCGLDSTPSIAVDAAGSAQAAWSRAAVPDLPVVGQRAGPVARHGARGRQLEDRARASRSTAASRRPTWRSARTAPRTSRTPATTPATRACTRRRTSRGRGSRRGWRRWASVSTWAGRGSPSRPTTAWTSRGARPTGSPSRPGPPARGAPPPSRPPTRPATSTSCATGSTLHLAIGLVDGLGKPSGIAYATSSNGGPWSVEAVDTGNDVTPRLAVDAAGHAHVSYLRAGPEHEVRYATNAAGDWATEVVDAGFNWGRPAFGVDAAGVRHVAVGRTGEDPGVWYGTDAGGHWTMERLTDQAPDGTVGLAVAPDGTASIAYAEFFATDGTPLADRAVRVTTGKPGAWTTTRVADDTGDASPAIARDAVGHLHVAFGTNAGGLDGLSYATNASGSWVVTPVTPGAAGQADRHPAIALDAAGKAHIAFERSTDDPLPDGTVSIGYATNATGSWASSVVALGPEYRLDPSIALDASGRPRIAYWIDNGAGALGSAGGVRLATFNGSTWATATISSSPLDGRPSLAIDTLGRSHVLFARAAAVLDLRRPAVPVGARAALLVGHAGVRRRRAASPTTPTTPSRRSCAGPTAASRAPSSTSAGGSRTSGSCGRCRPRPRRSSISRAPAPRWPRARPGSSPRSAARARRRSGSRRA